MLGGGGGGLVTLLLWDARRASRSGAMALGRGGGRQRGDWWMLYRESRAGSGLELEWEEVVVVLVAGGTGVGAVTCTPWASAPP